MEANIIKIGNSQGLRIPNVLIKQYGLKDKVGLVSTPRGLLITPATPRKNWKAAFKQVASNQDKKNSSEMIDVANDFDDKDWTW